MGATDFEVQASGKTAVDTFWRVVEEARWEHGHGGYTDTIAEKDSFKMLDYPGEPRDLDALRTFIDEHLELADKWGPAFCIDLDPDSFSDDHEWLFFGMASV